jgi:hypothetical protein
VRKIWRGHVFTTVHMGSSRYFVPHELHAVGADGGLEPLPHADGAQSLVTRRSVPLPA